jgi:hypothetical protein
MMTESWPTYRYNHMWSSELFFLKGNAEYQQFIKEGAAKRRPANLDMFYDICDLDLERLQSYLPKKIIKTDQNLSQDGVEAPQDNPITDGGKNGLHKSPSDGNHSANKSVEFAESQDQSVANQSTTSDRHAYFEQYKNKILAEDAYPELSVLALEKIFQHLADAALYATMARSWRQLQIIATFSVNILVNEVVRPGEVQGRTIWLSLVNIVDCIFKLLVDVQKNKGFPDDDYVNVFGKKAFECHLAKS